MKLATASILALAVVVGPVVAAPKHPAKPLPRYSIPATGVLTNRDMAAIAALAHAETDQFSEETGARFLGREFVVTIPLYTFEPEYDRATQTVTFEYPLRGRMEFDRSYRLLGYYNGQNTYGARARVESNIQTVAEIQAINADDTTVRILSSRKLEPSGARAISKPVALRLFGKIAREKPSRFREGPGRIISTDGSVYNATVDSPKDIIVRYGIVNVELTGAELVNTKTKDVLGSWGSIP